MNNYNLKVGLLTLAAKEIKGVGNVFIRDHVTTQDFFSSNIVSLIAMLLKEKKKEISEDLIYQVTESSKQILEICTDENIKVLTIFDAEFPNNLKQISNAPSLIFVKGNISILGTNTACIIGTRKPNENGIRIAQKVAEHYKQRKWNICNGLADGIDTAAIQQDSNYYSNVIGIVAGGLAYNRKKTLLKKTSINAESVIEAGGVVISEFPPEDKETTFSVVKSCKLQADISDGLILIQSSIDGGSKYTLESYCKTGRPIAVINPVKDDEKLDSYSANIAIRDNPIAGLSQITGLKSDKINTKSVTVLNSKNDYDAFDAAISARNSQVQMSKTLFD